jgi:DNA-binding response OmpR family regulator
MARILVIDDDAGVRAAIKVILQRRGHSVVLAECGCRGAAATEVYAFDVLIVDMFMPDLDGLETIKILRRCDAAVKIIAISGYLFREGASAAPDFLRMAMEFGASACLQKPFTLRELVAAVEANIWPGALLGVSPSGTWPGADRAADKASNRPESAEIWAAPLAAAAS